MATYGAVSMRPALVAAVWRLWAVRAAIRRCTETLLESARRAAGTGSVRAFVFDAALPEAVGTPWPSAGGVCSTVPGSI